MPAKHCAYSCWVATTIITNRNVNRPFRSTLNRMTEEILFEVYDCQPDGRNRFMGLAIVGVEELLVNPYQRQVLSLQTRPYQDDPVSGTLTLEVSSKRKKKKKNLEKAGG